MSLLEHCLIPDWPAPANVRALQTTRVGGVSAAPYDTLNLGSHVGDAPRAVAHNRQLLSPLMPSEPVWLEQVHGTRVIDAGQAGCVPQADASVAHQKGAVCVVMTADCLPVLLCDKAGTVVGAAHAGWKGLAVGVIEATVRAMDADPATLMAWLGPAISQPAFEVGAEVRAAFLEHDAKAVEAFMPFRDAAGVQKYHADLYLLARHRLHALGITRIHGGNLCTYRQQEQFFSFRRDGVTGRMGTFIWME